MTEIKFEDISSEQFVQAIQKLVRAPLQVKTAYQVKKWTDEIQAAKRQISEEFKAMMEQFAKKDADGKFVYDEQGSLDIEADKLEAFEKAQKEFGQKVVKIDRWKIWIHELSNAQGISAMDIHALMPILSEEPHSAQIAQIHG